MIHPHQLHIGLIGGTGDEGKGLALRWALAGTHVTIGSRSLERACAAAAELNGLLGAKRIECADNHSVASGSDFVLLTVPFDHAADTLQAHYHDFRPGSVLLDITVPVTFEETGARYVQPSEGSASEHLQRLLPPGVTLAAAFKTEPAHLMLDPKARLDCDTFVACDSKETRDRVMDAIRLIDGLRPVDAGPIRNAQVLERMTVFLIGINRRYKVRNGRFQILGLGAGPDLATKLTPNPGTKQIS
jgi:NADPH-dependent F420 reductase